MNNAARVGNRINQNRARFATNSNTNVAAMNKRRQMIINSKKAMEKRLRKRQGIKIEYDSNQNVIDVNGETIAFQRAMISEQFK